MLKNIFFISTLLVSIPSYSSEADIISESVIQTVLENSSPEIQENLQSNPELLPSFAKRINLAYKISASGDPSAVAAASSMISSFISTQSYSYNLPPVITAYSDETALDCSLDLALSQAAAQDALNLITNYNMNNYIYLPDDSNYNINANDIVAGILQGAMITGIGVIAADQVAIGTYQVCNEDSQKALSYTSTITNLSNTIFTVLTMVK
ncbi:hypothetical protein [uncultured Vibrio sp.]|uniref:hypothetical protein n=1 Tax=uncultured Vibrio sp. TaxID=114054 RepID=UPI002626F495|nr:hypothetical protein [uncultured Vibrio sp.]